MWKLAGFADEISPNLDEQIKVCQELGVTHFELRGVAGKNVLDFDAAMRADIKAKLAAGDIGVACIGSPIGKVKITDDWATHFDRFKIAVESANFFDAPFIRIFSYYPDEGGDILKYRDEVVRRMIAKVDYLQKNSNAVLVHENEAKIFGEKGSQCLDLMQAVNSPRFRTAFDFANFVQAKEKPLDCWPMLKPYTVHIHIKDALWDTGNVTPAGQGDGHISEILIDAYNSGYQGFVSLEPHLAHHGQLAGFSGPALFKVAADALKAICRNAHIPLAGV